MSCRKEKPTRLAKTIANHLFAELQGPTDFTCISTGTRVIGYHSYSEASRINVNAIGGYYTAFGYIYLLCIDEVTHEDYIAIHEDDASARLIGTMDNPNEIQVFIRHAEITS